MRRVLRHRREKAFLLAVALALAWPFASTPYFHTLLPGYHAMHDDNPRAVIVAPPASVRIVDLPPPSIAQAIAESPADRLRVRARRSGRSFAFAMLPMATWLWVCPDRVSLDGTFSWMFLGGGGRTLGNAIATALHWSS